MARTTPRVWEGETKLSPEVVARLYDQYVTALGDEDKAGDVEDCVYYEGWREALEWVLDVLYGIENITLTEAMKQALEGTPKEAIRSNYGLSNQRDT